MPTPNFNYPNKHKKHEVLTIFSNRSIQHAVILPALNSFVYWTSRSTTNIVAKLNIVDKSIELRQQLEMIKWKKHKRCNNLKADFAIKNLSSKTIKIEYHLTFWLSIQRTRACMHAMSHKLLIFQMLHRSFGLNLLQKSHFLKTKTRTYWR